MAETAADMDKMKLSVLGYNNHLLSLDTKRAEFVDNRTVKYEVRISSFFNKRRNYSQDFLYLQQFKNSINVLFVF